MNLWSDGKETVKSESRPSHDHHPVINLRRISGANWRPYTTGSDEWKRAANRSLASIAQSNFETRR